MARYAIGSFAAVLAIGFVLGLIHLLKPHEVVTSTPSSYTGVTVPIDVPARGTACADEILFDTNSRIARFSAVAPAGGGPALEVSARGQQSGPYRNDYRAQARIPAGWQGTRQFDVPLTPPRQAAFGTLCVRNTSGKAVGLVGTETGRAIARPTVRVNDQKIDTEFRLTLLDKGERSDLERAPQIAAQASTLRPLGAWWWWLLGIAVLVLAPVGVGAAIRSAVPATLPESAPAAAWPSERLRRRAEAIPGWWIVLGLGGLAALWLIYWALNTHVFQGDEDQYLHLSRWLPHHLPESIWAIDTYGRGLQRIEVWMLAVPGVLFDAPWSLGLGHALNALAFVSTAIPVYLLGRGLGLNGRWAALPAVVSVLVPWAVLATSLLSENVAYPAFAWAIWGIWRSAEAPSAGRDVLALVLLLVGGLSRTALLLLVPVLPAVVLITDLRCAAGDVRSRLLGSLRSHVVLWGAVALGLLVLLAGAAGVGPSASKLAGGYGTHYGIDDWGVFIDKTGAYLARVVLGTGFLPAAVGLPWLALTLAKVREPARFAFAATAVLSALALLYLNHTAGPDERYILYLAPPLLLAATVAVARRELSPPGIAIVSVLLGLLMLRVPWSYDQGAFGFFTAPVEMFYSRAVGLRFDRYLPGGIDAALTLGTLALTAAGLALAAVLRWRRGWLDARVGAVLIAGVVAGVLLQTDYTVTKHVNGVGSRSAPGLKARAFVDRLVPKGASVGELAEGVGRRPDFNGVWQEVQFYNDRLDKVYATGTQFMLRPTGDELVDGVRVDRATGRIQSPKPLPDYLVIPTQVGDFRVRGDIVRAQSYIPVALLRVAKPATAAWTASGVGADGAIVDPEGATVRVYGTGLRPGRHCAAFDLLGAPTWPVRWRASVDGHRVARGTVDAAKSGLVPVDLPDLAQRGHADVRFSGEGVRLIGISVDGRC